VQVNDPGPVSSTTKIGADIDHHAKQDTQTIKNSIEKVTGRITSAINGGQNTLMAAIAGLKTSISQLGSARSSAPAAAAPAAQAGGGGAPGVSLGQYAAGIFGSAPNASPNGLTLGSGLANLVSSSPFFATGGQFAVGPNKGLADGGAFTVPGGDSGSDSVDVEVKAAPGEKIFVVPPDKADKMKGKHKEHNKVTPTVEPISDYIGAGPPAAVPGNDNAAVTSAAGGGWAGVPMRQSPVATASAVARSQPINIIVQDKVQADSFIRSRAQIQRAMGR